ncbi:hypothetical protein [Halogranum rubrum]|nr:hypothetical protein [Halogranum rubrum]
MTGPSSRRRFLRRVGATLSAGSLASLSGCTGGYNGPGMSTHAGFRIANYDEEERRSHEWYVEFADYLRESFGEHAPWSGTGRSPFPDTATFQWALAKPGRVRNQFVYTRHIAVVYRDSEAPTRYYLYLWSGGRPNDDREMLADEPNLRHLGHNIAYNPEWGTMTEWQPRPPVDSGPASVSLGGEVIQYPLGTGRIERASMMGYDGQSWEDVHSARWSGSTERSQSFHSVASFEVTSGEFNPAIDVTFGGSERGGPLF